MTKDILSLNDKLEFELKYHENEVEQYKKLIDIYDKLERNEIIPIFNWKHDNEFDVNGSYFLFYIKTNFENLIKLFGFPSYLNVNNENLYDNKIFAEWILNKDSNIITIYNYKNHFNYMGKLGMNIFDISRWHIGGFKKENVLAIFKNIEEHHKELIKIKQY